MRRLVLAVILACVLSSVAQAGEIPSTGVTAGPPPSSVTAIGEIPSTGAPAPQPASTLAMIVLMIVGIAR